MTYFLRYGKLESMAKSLLKLNTKTFNKLLSCLGERARDVIERRFGIGKAFRRETLEAIGQSYKITRERVRQIEEQSLKKMKSAPAFKEVQNFLGELKELIEKRGGVVPEKIFLDEAGSFSKAGPGQKNYIHFFLVLGSDFEKLKEDQEFHPRWTTNRDQAEEIHRALKNLHQKIDPASVYSEDDLITHFADCAQTHLKLKEEPPAEILKLWLRISRLLGKNVIGEWGFVSSPQIKPRGVKDLAYLVMKQHGSPMHFTEVAKAITKNLSQPAHAQTVHNELIKDSRFVLVGRGLYALAGWGYKPGLVRDIIKDVLKENGALGKEDIVKKVLKERYVKENTILINLNNRALFQKNLDGTYSTV